MILVFEKPPRAKSVESWKSISADGAPPGVYTPNMSADDAEKWRAKIVGTQSGNHQIEIRSTAPGCNVVIVVNGAMPNQPQTTSPLYLWLDKPHNVKVSANGPMWMPPEVMASFNEAIAEAHILLRELDVGTRKAEILRRYSEG